MTTNTLTADNGVISGTSGIKYNGGNDGTLTLQTTTSGGTATNAVYIDNTQQVGVGGTGDLVGVALQNSSYTTAYAADLGGNAATAGYGSQLQVVSPSDSSTVSGISLFTRTTGRSRWDILNVWSSTYLGSLVFRYRSAGSNTAEAMRIDSSGNLLVGTTISPTVNNGKELAMSATANRMGYISDDSSHLGYLQAYDSSGFTNLYNTYTSGGLRFFTGTSGGTERARIDSSGRLLIGTTSTILSASNLLCASSSGYTAAFSTSGGASYHALGLVNTGTTGTRYFTQFYAGATPTNTGGISTADGTTTVYATSSDYRLKENISPMTGALATVAQLKPVNYTWKATGHSTQGFIAHELHAVVPECVVGEKDAVDADGNPVYQGIDTSFLVATLTAAIQEQQALITQLTTRIAALEAK
jgi:hypothetical protein